MTYPGPGGHRGGWFGRRNPRRASLMSLYFQTFASNGTFGAKPFGRKIPHRVSPPFVDMNVLLCTLFSSLAFVLLTGCGLTNQRIEYPTPEPTATIEITAEEAAAAAEIHELTERIAANMNSIDTLAQDVCHSFLRTPATHFQNNANQAVNATLYRFENDEAFRDNWDARRAELRRLDDKLERTKQQLESLCLR